MEWLDILERIELGEDRHTEFKRGLGDLSAIGRGSMRAEPQMAEDDGGEYVRVRFHLDPRESMSS